MINRPLEDWEYPEPDENEDDFDTQACPFCGADVYEDAERCPACGDYVVFSNSALSGWPWWFVVLGLLGILAVILAMSS